MKLVIVSHKLCWPSPDSPTGYATDGGFPFQIEAISELFDETSLIVPSGITPPAGLAPIKGRRMTVVTLLRPNGSGLSRKLGFPLWLLRNGKVIWREVRRGDAVHTPIPGDVGTIGMIMAIIARKPLFVRYCGDWFVQRTAVERLWKWSIEYFAGGRNVMMATGGSTDFPSSRNANVKWIFSTSLRRAQMAMGKPGVLPDDGRIRLIIACRQEERKGTDVIIQAMPAILRSFPNARLDVIGDGSLLRKLKELTFELGVNQNITFHGKLEHSSVLKLFSKGHLFCYPTAASEGFPKVVLEALAQGMPVITTRVSVLPQLIGLGCGVLLDSDSPLELSQAVIDVCSKKTQYSEMSKKAIKVSKRYCLEDWRDLIGKTLKESWEVNSLCSETRPVD